MLLAIAKAFAYLVTNIPSDTARLSRCYNARACTLLFTIKRVIFLDLTGHSVCMTLNVTFPAMVKDHICCSVIIPLHFVFVSVSMTHKLPQEFNWEFSAQEII